MTGEIKRHVIADIFGQTCNGVHICGLIDAQDESNFKTRYRVWKQNGQNYTTMARSFTHGSVITKLMNSLHLRSSVFVKELVWVAHLSALQLTDQSKQTGLFKNT